MSSDLEMLLDVPKLDVPNAKTCRVLCVVLKSRSLRWCWLFIILSVSSVLANFRSSYNSFLLSHLPYHCPESVLGCEIISVTNLSKNNDDDDALDLTTVRTTVLTGTFKSFATAL